MATTRCPHGKFVPGEDCTECGLNAYALDMGKAQAQTAPAADPPSREDFHRFQDPASPERTCPVCQGKYRGPLSVCSRRCERDWTQPNEVL